MQLHVAAGSRTSPLHFPAVNHDFPLHFAAERLISAGSQNLPLHFVVGMMIHCWKSQGEIWLFATFCSGEILFHVLQLNKYSTVGSQILPTPNTAASFLQHWPKWNYVWQCQIFFSPTTISIRYVKNSALFFLPISHPPLSIPTPPYPSPSIRLPLSPPLLHPLHHTLLHPLPLPPFPPSLLYYDFSSLLCIGTKKRLYHKILIFLYLDYV